MKTYVCGNSHVGALKGGLDLLAYSGRQELALFPLGNGMFETSPFSVVSEARVKPIVPEYAINLKRSTGLDFFDPDHHWGLSMGTHNARVYRNPFWVTSEPAIIASGKARPISDGVLSGIVETDQRFIRSFFLQLKSAGGHLFAVSCPYPRLDHDCLGQGIRRETIAYIDQFARRQFADWLAANDIDLIEPPPECCTEDGFLVPEYNAEPSADGTKDPHHANAAYGKLMMERVVAYLEEF